MKRITPNLIRAKSKKGMIPSEIVFEAEAKQPIASQANQDDILSLLQDSTVS